jgi:integrase/recombinase XerD
MKNLDEYKEHLKETLSPSTIESYIYKINQFIQANQDPTTATYTTLINYIGQRRQEVKPTTLNSTLQALKSYFNYLAITNQRPDNPAASIYIRDKISKDIHPQDLFSAEELESLLTRKERYPMLKNRNLLIITLLIYQALKSSEIKELELHDIDLTNATIHIKAQRKTNQRTLKLNANQVIYLLNYINQERPNLIKNPDDRGQRPKLFLSKLGNPEQGEGIQYLIESSRHLFPGKTINPSIIRKSVLFNLLKAGNNLRVVQVFAGHKTPSSTEKYKQSNFEILKQNVLKHHPIN